MRPGATYWIPTQQTNQKSELSSRRLHRPRALPQPHRGQAQAKHTDLHTPLHRAANLPRAWVRKDNGAGSVQCTAMSMHPTMCATARCNIGAPTQQNDQECDIFSSTTERCREQQPEKKPAPTACSGYVTQGRENASQRGVCWAGAGRQAVALAAIALSHARSAAHMSACSPHART